MKKLLVTTLLAAAVTGGQAQVKHQSHGYPIDPVPFTSVKVTDSFWGQRLKAQNRPDGLLFCVLPAHLLFLTEQQPHHLKADLRFLSGGFDSGEISLSSVFLDCPKVVIELL